MKAATLLGSLAIAMAPLPSLAQTPSHHASPYAGLETREIKSLSDADIKELRRGGGWGLALAAELNGIPGPAHLLELGDVIPLRSEQVQAIQSIFNDMKAEAVAAGVRLVAAEGAIEAAFRAGGLDEARLRSLIAEASAARGELRFIHLSRHLSTPSLLSREQIARYNALRGYASDPCATAPDGHDAEMWRKHNGCR